MYSYKCTYTHSRVAAGNAANDFFVPISPLLATLFSLFSSLCFNINKYIYIHKMRLSPLYRHCIYGVSMLSSSRRLIHSLYMYRLKAVLVENKKSYIAEWIYVCICIWRERNAKKKKKENKEKKVSSYTELAEEEKEFEGERGGGGRERRD